MRNNIAARRLANHRLTRAPFTRAEDVVAWHGAVQAQEFEPAKWALGLRMHEHAAADDIQRAFDAGEILRTHVLRPTWHFVAPADIRWMLELTAPRIHRAMSSYTRTTDMDRRLFIRSTKLIERALGGGQPLTRKELGEYLRRHGLALDGLHLGHVAMYAELERVICSGPRRGKHSTYALLAERAPHAASLTRDEALATLCRRYLQSHGPATVRDFVWWSGLLTADATRAMAMAGARSEVVDDRTYWSLGESAGRTPTGSPVHLLPIYDEYVVAYRDREAVPHGPATVAARPGHSVTFRHSLIVDGRITGTWRTTSRARSVELACVPLRKLTADERGDLAAAVARYERFLGVPVVAGARSRR